MNMREEQAFNDGRMAYREGRGIHTSSRRNVAQRAEWIRGFEHERGLDLAKAATPAELAESKATLSALKQWVTDNL